MEVFYLSDFFVHPNAIVESSNIGEGTRVWAFSHILKGAVIGKDCNICDHTFIENDVLIGDDVTIKCGIYIWDGVHIEDKVFLGPNVVFTNDLRPRSKMYPSEFAKTHVHYGASIGANATIIAGNVIGKWAMVGAGAVVTKDVPDYALVYGNPAKIKGYVCKCTEKLQFKDGLASCSCGENYSLENGKISERIKQRI